MKNPPREHGPDPAFRFVRETLYDGPVYRKLYALRERRPELSYELDDLAMALGELGERIEAFLRRQVIEPGE